MLGTRGPFPKAPTGWDLFTVMSFVEDEVEIECELSYYDKAMAVESVGCSSPYGSLQTQSHNPMWCLHPFSGHPAIDIS